MKPTQEQVTGAWAEAIAKKGLCIGIVDDVHFRVAITMMSSSSKVSLYCQYRRTCLASYHNLPHKTCMSTKGFRALEYCRQKVDSQGPS